MQLSWSRQTKEIAEGYLLVKVRGHFDQLRPVTSAHCNQDLQHLSYSFSSLDQEPTVMHTIRLF